MTLRRYGHGLVLIIVGWIIASLALVSSKAQTQGNKTLPLRASDFVQAAPRGFGDRNNTWPQAMVWWHGNLYVGTARASLCTSLAAIYPFFVQIFGQALANIYFPYPPTDPDLSCAADAADLPLQAEIWRWTPHVESWERVFQSPLALDNPGTGPPLPPRTGKKLPYEIAFRGFAPHTDPDGTEALYAFGVNSTVLWDRNKLPPPRILRTTDGVNWTPLPQAPGTFLGSLPFNPDHSSFRSPVSFNGKLFVLSGPIFGQGALIGSANPAQGNNAWFLASPQGLQFYELAAFNGWLYIGGFDPLGGYTVLKTRAEGTPPYPLTMVVPSGAGLAVRPSRSVVSMQQYFGRLYVGTASQTEIVRINPDDTWDLVIGPPRVAPSPDGGTEWKYPISGLDAGFGHTLNDHAWQMDDPYRFFYIGTYNASTGSRRDPVNGPLLRHNMGAHLYRTPDGWYYNPVTTNGFASPSDPHGGIFDYGIRTMASTPFGFFLGLTNDHFGLMIFRAANRSQPFVDPPERLEVEPGRSGSALLSWRVVPRATEYEIWRAEINLILARDDVNIENWNTITGNKVPDIYTGPFQLIGTTPNLTFIDATVRPGQRYMYYVKAEIQKSQVSDPSNLVNFPLLTPPMTFAQLLREVDRLDKRQRFRNSQVRFTTIRSQIVDAKGAAAACRIKDALKLNAESVSNAALDPDSTDLEILTNKLLRRLQLFSQYPQEVQSNEFCIP